MSKPRKKPITQFNDTGNDETTNAIDTENNSDSNISSNIDKSIKDIMNPGKRLTKEDTHKYKGFWLEKGIVDVINSNTGKVKGDKSDLVNKILKKYFIDNGYM